MIKGVRMGGVSKKPVSILSQGLSYESYCRLWRGDEPALKVYGVWKEVAIKHDAMDCWQYLGELVVSMMVAILVTCEVMKLTYISDHKIWITSPSGKTTVQLPLYDALRVIKKREWKFAEVELVKPQRVITRAEALKILFFRNNRLNGEATRAMAKQWEF